MSSAALDLALLPDAAGHFGPYGGVFVPETLIAALEQLEAEYKRRTGTRSLRGSLIIICGSMWGGRRGFILPGG